MPNLIVYDLGPTKSGHGRFHVNLDVDFANAQAAQKENDDEGCNRQVVVFMPFNLDDHAVRAFAAIMELAQAADDGLLAPREIPLATLLSRIFVAGRDSV